jgi:hypothetical protein
MPLRTDHETIVQTDAYVDQVFSVDERPNNERSSSRPDHALAEKGQYC